MIDPSDPGSVFRQTSTASRSSGIGLAEYVALHRVPWTLAYIGFMIYFTIITTYIANLGTVAMAVAIVALFLGDGRIRWPLPTRIFVMFWMWASLSTVLSEYPGDFEELLTFGRVLLVFLVSVNVLRHPRRLRFFLLFYVACFALYPARGTLFNYFIYSNAAFGRAAWRDSFGNPNDMAALTLLALALAASFLHKQVPSIVRFGALLASCLVFPVVILMTQSRAAFIGLSVFVLLVVLSARQKRMRAIVAVAVVAAIVITVAPADVWQRIAGLQYATSTETIGMIDPEGSAEQRWEIWQTGFNVIADHPVLGVGLGRYEQANSVYNPSLGRRDIHDTYLEVLAETGVPGLVLFLWLLAASILRARRARRNAQALRGSEDWQRLVLLELGLYGYLVAGVWGTFGYLSLLYIYLAIVYAQAEVLDAQAAEASGNPDSSIPVGPRTRHGTQSAANPT